MKRLTPILCLLVLATALRSQGKETLPPLAQASKEQQKSISQLVSALKEIRKMIPAPGEPSAPKPEKKNPFKDKQQYQKPPPANQLQDLKKQQQEIIDQLKEDAKKEEGSPNKSSESAEKQQKISDELKKLEENTDLNPAVREAVKEAAEASDEAAEAMKESANTEAQVGAEKTLAKISKALEEQKKDAGKRAEEALDKAAQELSAAEQARQNKDGKEAGKRAEEALKALEEAARQQKLSGSEEEAKKLEDLAKKMRDDELIEALNQNPGDQATADQLAEMREAVAKARQGDKTAREEMEEAAQALEELKKEMQYRAKNPQELTDPQLDEMKSQCDGLAQRIGRAQSQMEDQGNEQRNSMEADTHAVASLIRDTQDTPPKEVVLKQLIELTDRILIKAQQCLDALEKETVVRNLSRDEVPEKYKEDVATYFERLSQPENE